MPKKIHIKNPKSSSAPKDADAWVKSREENKRLTFDLPTTLHAKLKIYSVNVNKTMGEIIIELLEEKLKY
jgi:hypothetical protein